MYYSNNIDCQSYESQLEDLKLPVEDIQKSLSGVNLDDGQLMEIAAFLAEFSVITFEAIKKNYGE